MKRLFIALHLEPTEEFLDAFGLIKEQLAIERIKWVEEENLHLTLKFIGEISEDEVHDIDYQLKSIPRTGKIGFNIEGVGLIKNLQDPRAIYANIKNEDGVESLSSKINSCLKEIGIAPDTKSFLPHLTLGRIKVLRDKERLRDILMDFRNHYFQHVIGDEFILFESILTPSGPIYKKISRYPI